METYAGIAIMLDGTTRITSGTLMECAEWADDVRSESKIKEIVIKVVPKQKFVRWNEVSLNG